MECVFCLQTQSKTNSAKNSKEFPCGHVSCLDCLSVCQRVVCGTCGQDIGDVVGDDSSIPNVQSAKHSTKVVEKDDDPPTFIDECGTKFWKRNGQPHRDGDLPAIVYANGTKCWYKNAERHRDGDLPAIIRSNGSQSWYKDGKLHRDGDQPAIMYADGTKEWYKNGQNHRDNDLPAIIKKDGTKKWFKNGVEYRPTNSTSTNSTSTNSTSTNLTEPKVIPHYHIHYVQDNSKYYNKYAKDIYYNNYINDFYYKPRGYTSQFDTIYKTYFGNMLGYL